MMDDPELLKRRAREERERASIHENNTAALAHLALADAFEERLRRIQERVGRFG